MLRPRTVALFLAMCLLWASPCRADRLLLAPSASLGLPIGPSASLATATSLAGSGLTWSDTPTVILDGSIGVGGWRASLGYGVACYGDAILLDAGLVGGRVTVLRTWGRPFNARARETYVGTTLVWRVAGKPDDSAWGVDLGALYRVDGPRHSGRLMPYVAIDIGRFLAL